MKNLKRFLAFAICTVLAVSCFAGCHKKNETAVTIGGYTFTSGYYACALVYADTEARQKVDDALTKAGKSTEKVDYMKQKIDGTKFEKWVKDKAIENLKVIAGYKELCKELKLTVTAENVETAKNYANNYWQYYGYSQIFGENGVSQETFTQYTIDTYYSDKYFDAVYGKEGTTPVTEEQIKEALQKNCALVYKLETDTTSISEDEKKAKMAEYDRYVEQYKAGTTFEEIYVNANGPVEEETAEETTDGPTEKPLDKRTELIGNMDSGFYSEIYADVAEMKVGEAKVIEKENNLTFVVRLDVLSDPYYITTNDETLRKLYAGDTCNQVAIKKADSLGVKQVDYAVDLFKVKNIKYPETTTIG